MKKVTKKTRKRSDPNRDTLREEYDFSRARRGVTAPRYAEGSNMVVLEPDVFEIFPTSKAVNEALRALAGAAKRIRTRAHRRGSA